MWKRDVAQRDDIRLVHLRHGLEHDHRAGARDRRSGVIGSGSTRAVDVWGMKSRLLHGHSSRDARSSGAAGAKGSGSVTHLLDDLSGSLRQQVLVDERVEIAVQHALGIADFVPVRLSLTSW